MTDKQNETKQYITLRKPDDFHVHLRDHDFLKLTVNHSAERFSRIGVMPNLVPPVTTIAAAHEYRQRILKALDTGRRLEPLMILFLKKDIPLADIQYAAQDPYCIGLKYYPSGVTTNSLSELSNIQDAARVLETMEEHSLPLLIHGESASPHIDVFDREKRFLSEQLDPLVQRYPNLRIVLEHITTSDAVDFVSAQKNTVGATITAHHLIFNRNDMLGDGLKPHLYCKPILKRAHHQQALRKAATSGSSSFFLGSDSAPHGIDDKESACGCAGCYTSHAAIELYAEVFDEEDALHHLEAFSSEHGAQFYGLDLNDETITLVKEDWFPERFFMAGDKKIVPLRADSPLKWTLRHK